VTVDPRQRNLEHKRALIVWGAFVMTQLLFVALLLAGIAPGRSQPGELLAVFAVLALGAAIGGHAMWRRARGSFDRVMRETPDPATLLPFYIVAWAFDETIALCGLVLGVLGFPPAVWSAFSAAGFILTLMHRPA
jgi:hypothetical protein